ncbi:MAG: YdcF family protein [Rubrobacter sp.]|nr:YdcF family protein [Rubrobacter sp.]
MRTVITLPTVPDSLLGELRALVRLYRGGSVLLEGGTPAEGEAAVILGAQVLSEGKPSATLKARVWHAARLYAEREVRLLIPTGGVGEHPPSEAEVAAGMLQKAGVPEEAILLEGQARNTRESAWLVAAIARRRGIRSVVVVTDPLHCVRAVGAFRAEGVPVSASPVYSSPMWRKPRLRREQLLREIGAVVWYRLRRRAGSRFRP